MKKSKEQLYAETLEKLHDVEVPPFNPDYNEELVQRNKKINEAYHKVGDYLYDIPVSSACDEEVDKILDVLFIRLNAVYKMHNYSVDENGKITHSTEIGRDNIQRFNANKGFAKNTFVREWKMLCDKLGIEFIEVN